MKNETLGKLAKQRDFQKAAVGTLLPCMSFRSLKWELLSVRFYTRKNGGWYVGQFYGASAYGDEESHIRVLSLWWPLSQNNLVILDTWFSKELTWWEKINLMAPWLFNIGSLHWVGMLGQDTLHTCQTMSAYLRIFISCTQLRTENWKPGNVFVGRLAIPTSF